VRRLAAAMDCDGLPSPGRWAAASCCNPWRQQAAALL